MHLWDVHNWVWRSIDVSIYMYLWNESAFSYSLMASIWLAKSLSFLQGNTVKVKTQFSLHAALGGYQCLYQLMPFAGVSYREILPMYKFSLCQQPLSCACTPKTEGLCHILTHLIPGKTGSWGWSAPPPEIKPLC